MKSYVFFIPVALLVLSCAKPNEKIEPVLRELDETIDNRQRFENEKQDRIARLKKDLQETDNIHKRTELYYSLFDQYKNYQYDSAFVYAKLLEKNAETLHQGSVAIAKEAERGVVDIETLQAVLTKHREAHFS